MCSNDDPRLTLTYFTSRSKAMLRQESPLMGAPGFFGIWGEWLFIFRELGSTGNYFRGAREQAHSFGDLGSPAKKKKKIRKSLHFV